MADGYIVPGSSFARPVLDESEPERVFSNTLHDT
jgi:hypothetical protein